MRVSVVVWQLGVGVTTFGGGDCRASEVILITGIFVVKCEKSCVTVWFWPWQWSEKKSDWIVITFTMRAECREFFNGNIYSILDTLLMGYRCYVIVTAL